MERGTDVTGPITVEQQARVEAWLRHRDLSPRYRERLEMVKAAGRGEEVAAIARWSGRTPRTVRRWLTAFREGGIGALVALVALWITFFVLNARGTNWFSGAVDPSAQVLL